jgi:hypothetical protein
VAGGAQPYFLSDGWSAVGLDAHDAVSVLQETRDLAVLDDVHAELVAFARKGPRHVVVLGGCRRAAGR